MFDAPERRKDDGANHGAIGATWNVPRANVPTLAKFILMKLQTKPVDGYNSNLMGRWAP